MRVLAVTCLALVACDDAVAIEVRIPPGIEATRVELFLGETACVVGEDQPCPGIGPPGIGAVIPGEVFEVDDPERFFIDIPAGTDTVEFRLEGGGELPVVLAVASSVQGPAAIAIMRDVDLASGARRYVAALEPAPEMLDPDLARNGFLIWPPARTPYSCIGMQFHGERVFVVPDDFDCDEAADCSQFVFNASGPLDLPTENTTCAILRAPDPLGGPHCMLGGPPCDEPGNNTSLLPCDNRRDICTSPAVCDCSEPGGINLTCLEGKLAAEPSLATRIVCGVTMRVDPSNSGQLVPCTGETAMPAQLITSATDCSVRIGRLEIGGFLSDVVKISNDPLELKIRVNNTGCQYALAWDGALPAPAGGEEIPNFRGMTEISNGTRASVIALEVHFFNTGVCEPDSCVIVDDANAADNALDCLKFN